MRAEIFRRGCILLATMLSFAVGQAFAQTPAPPDAILGLPEDFSLLRSAALPPGDVEVLVTSTWSYAIAPQFLLRRKSGVWSGLACLPERPSSVPCQSQMPLLTPEGGWERLWNRLTAQNIETLPDQSMLPNLKTVNGQPPLLRLDGVVSMVELNLGGRYRKYEYFDPSLGKHLEDKEMVEIVRIIRRAFNLRNGFEGVTPLSAEVARHFLHDDFQEYREISGVPGWVWGTLYNCGWNGGLMVKPGEALSRTASPANQWPGPMRLIFVATAGDYCVLAYEQGGKSYSRNALLFHRDPQCRFGAVIEGSAIRLGARVNSLPDLRLLEKEAGVFRVRPFVP